jgi:hypothetical protein
VLHLLNLLVESRGGVGDLLASLKGTLDQYTSFDLSAQPLLQIKASAV